MNRCTSPLGIPIAQGWETMGLILEAINLFHIKTIIELGIWSGGFGEFLIVRNNYVTPVYYHGYDITTKYMHPRARLYIDNFTIADIFSPESMKDIQTKINQSVGNVLLFCDDGNKPKEMRVFTPLLRVGDFLVAHDYPVEVSPESLTNFQQTFPYMLEVESELYRNSSLTLWKRIK